MLDHLENVKSKLVWTLIALGSVLAVTSVIGGLFFDLDAAQIASWFSFIILLVFGIALIYSVVVFIIWFLFAPPPSIAFAVGALVVIIAAVFIFIKLIADPAVDIGAMLEPIFSFLK